MTTTPRSYRVPVTLTTGGLWSARVEELPEVEETHRSLSQLRTRVTRSIAQHEGVGSDTFVLDMEYSTGDPDFDQALDQARTTRHQAEELAKKARDQAKPLAQRLVRAGVSQRDAGTLLSISGALVSSLISTT